MDQILFDITDVNSEVNDEQWECIEYNIKKFKEWTG